MMTVRLYKIINFFLILGNSFLVWIIEWTNIEKVSVSSVINFSIYEYILVYTYNYLSCVSAYIIITIEVFFSFFLYKIISHMYYRIVKPYTSRIHMRQWVASKVIIFLDVTFKRIIASSNCYRISRTV